MKIILPTQIRALLEPQLPHEVDVVWVAPDSSFDRDPEGAVAYFRWWGEQNVYQHVLTHVPSLRWVHTPSAGVEHLLIPLVYERDLTLTNSAGVHAIPIAEFVMAVLLSRAKALHEYNTAQVEHQWAKDIDLQELYGATMLILGIGGIGTAIAERAAAFGMRVWGSRRRSSAAPTPYAERIVTGDAWRALLPEADYVVVAAPLTPETRHMVDAAALAAMKPSAYLINIARGGLVDETALLAALQAGQISGAALDTFEQEPLPATSPFWELPNVVVTPHATANSPRMHERQVALFLENLRRALRNEPLVNVVDKTLGY
ncbi:MAG: D-2-hydroxyacid dehydrogenase [Oscillochloridaceae bacterium umkhey_bin13]